MTSRRWDPRRSREGLIQRRDVETQRRDVTESPLCKIVNNAPSEKKTPLLMNLVTPSNF